MTARLAKAKGRKDVGLLACVYLLRVPNLEADGAWLKKGGCSKKVKQ